MAEAGTDTSSALLLNSMNNTIVSAATAASSNATNQLNASTSASNEQLRIHAHSEGVLGKRICELDTTEGMSTAEAMTRVSTTSQPFHLATGLAQLGGVNQHNQNLSNQGLMQSIVALQGTANAILAGVK